MTEERVFNVQRPMRANLEIGPAMRVAKIRPLLEPAGDVNAVHVRGIERRGC